MKTLGKSFSCVVRSDTESTLDKNSSYRGFYTRLSDGKHRFRWWWEQRYGVNVYLNNTALEIEREFCVCVCERKNERTCVCVFVFGRNWDAHFTRASFVHVFVWLWMCAYILPFWWDEQWNIASMHMGHCSLTIRVSIQTAIIWYNSCVVVVTDKITNWN